MMITVPKQKYKSYIYQCNFCAINILHHEKKQKLRFSTIHMQKIQIRYQTITYTYYYHHTSINYYLEISLIYTEPINSSTESNQNCLLCLFVMGKNLLFSLHESIFFLNFHPVEIQIVQLLDHWDNFLRTLGLSTCKALQYILEKAIQLII